MHGIIADELGQIEPSGHSAEVVVPVGQLAALPGEAMVNMLPPCPISVSSENSSKPTCPAKLWNVNPMNLYVVAGAVND